MFGAGNETTTVAEFEEVYNKDYYAYDLGTPKNVDISGLKTIGYNAWNGTVARVVKGELGSGKNNGYEVLGTYTTIDFAKTIDGVKTELTVYNDLGYDYILPPTDGYVWINGADATSWLHLVWSKGADTSGEVPEYWDSTRAIDSSLYFPNGMHGVKVWNGGVATEVYDELLPNKYIKKFGVVDLGSLAWGIGDDGLATERALAALSGIKHSLDNTTIANVFCSKYVASTNAKTYSHTNDKIISVHATNDAIYIYDSALIGKTGAEVKTALSGVYLVYELATYVETAISPALNFSYRVSDNGS
jgi:hypothetical protein